MSWKKCNSSGLRNNAAAIEWTGASPTERSDCQHGAFAELGELARPTPALVKKSSGLVEILEVPHVGVTAEEVKVSDLSARQMGQWRPRCPGRFASTSKLDL